jgi:hypothetical protein
VTLAHVNLAFDIELDVDTLSALLLLKRAVAAQPELAAAAEKPAEAAATPASPPAPRSHRVTRAAQQANGQASPAQEQAAVAAAAAPTPEPTPAAASAPRIPPEEELRPLLSKMAAVHHDKVKGVTDMLKAVGGFARLVECPPDTWPAIKQACDDAIAAAGG